MGNHQRQAQRNQLHPGEVLHDINGDGDERKPNQEAEKCGSHQHAKRDAGSPAEERGGNQEIDQNKARTDAGGGRTVPSPDGEGEQEDHGQYGQRPLHHVKRDVLFDIGSVKLGDHGVAHWAESSSVTPAGRRPS